MKCFLNIIYYREEKCVICSCSLSGEYFICKNCEHKLKKCKEHKEINIQGNLVHIYSALYYSSIVKEMVLKLKYKSDFKCGDILAYYMIEILKEENLDYDLITFVPLSPSARKSRGYNQSEYLAKVIGSYFGKPVKGLIYKTKETKDQIGLNGEERWNNLKGSFKVRNAKLKNKKILLIDDVITTGATSHYCCLELIKNEISKIFILTAAKSKI